MPYSNEKYYAYKETKELFEILLGKLCNNHLFINFLKNKVIFILELLFLN